MENEVTGQSAKLLKNHSKMKKEAGFMGQAY